MNRKKTIVFIIDCCILALACLLLLFCLLDAYVVDIPLIYNRPCRPLGLAANVFAILVMGGIVWRERKRGASTT